MRRWNKSALRAIKGFYLISSFLTNEKREKEWKNYANFCLCLSCGKKCSREWKKVPTQKWKLCMNIWWFISDILISFIIAISHCPLSISGSWNRAQFKYQWQYTSDQFPLSFYVGWVKKNVNWLKIYANAIWAEKGQKWFFWYSR